MKYLYTKLSFNQRNIGMVVAAPHEYKIRWEAIEISPETVDLFQEIEDGFEAAGVYTKHLWDLYNHQNSTITPLPNVSHPARRGRKHLVNHTIL